MFRNTAQQIGSSGFQQEEVSFFERKRLGFIGIKEFTLLNVFKGPEAGIVPDGANIAAQFCRAALTQVDRIYAQCFHVEFQLNLWL